MKKKFGGEFNIGEAEKAREEELRKAGALRGGTTEEQQLLSEREATAYQQYATEKEGIPLYEKASDYEEAEYLIKNLRDANINLEFLNIDWDKIDFNDAYAIGDLKARLDAATRQFLDQMQNSEEIDNEETKGFFNKAKEFLKNNKAAALPLALSVGLLIGCSKEDVNSGKKIIGEVIGESGKVIETVVKDSGVETSYGEDSAKILKEWKDKHPEVTKIVLSDLNSSIDTLHESHKLVTIAGERFKATAKIIIFTENETFLCHGDIESPDLHYVPGFSEMTTYAGKGLNKLLGKEGLEVDRVNELWRRNGKNAAIKKALENYESKISTRSNKKDSSSIEASDASINLPSQIEFDSRELSPGHLKYLTEGGFTNFSDDGLEAENNNELYKEIILKWIENIKAKYPAVNIKAMNLPKIKHSIKSFNDSDPFVGSGISIESEIEIKGLALKKFKSYGHDLHKMGRSAHDMTSVYLFACKNADEQALKESLQEIEGQIISLINPELRN